MDNDQEVVREPFEDHGSVRSLDQYCNHDREQSDANEPNNRDTGSASGANSACHSRHSVAETDHTDQLYRDGDSSSGDSCLAEEVNFAKSFGIDLADKKTSLLRSNHFEATAAAAAADSNKPGPMIKTSVTSDCIYHKGTFYQKGDIVALCDQDDGQLYFAQITGFLQDQYCEKSASVNWLVPHKPTSRDFFDPSAYRIGLEDATLRKLDCMTFVRHCPHDYYVKKFFQSGESASRLERTRDRSFIWTTLKPCRVPQIEAHISSPGTNKNNCASPDDDTSCDT